MTGPSRNGIVCRRPLQTVRLPRPLRAALVLGSVSLLAGCMYDPYSGTYYLCCSTPYYAYPGYVPYYAAYPPYDVPPPAYAEPQAATTETDIALAQRFAGANTTHDGRLTRQQAEAANWQVVAGNFPQIDIDQKGYVTLPEIRAWLLGPAPSSSNMHG